MPRRIRFFLHNGDRLTGTLISIADETVAFETVYAGVLKVEQRMVSQIETSRNYIFRGAAFEQRGQLLMINGQQSVGQPDDYSPLDITSIESADQVQRVVAMLPLDWVSRVDLSAVFSSGNSSTESFNTLAESRLRSSICILCRSVSTVPQTFHSSA